VSIQNYSETVTVSATLKHARVSAYKARQVLNVIRGHPFEEAQNLLKRIPGGSAPIILKLLNSAGANAETNERLSSDELYIIDCYANEGTTIKRFRARARGRATRIRKRTCHITIVLARMPDEIIETLRAKKAASLAQRRQRVAKSKKATQSSQLIETKESDDVTDRSDNLEDLDLQGSLEQESQSSQQDLAEESEPAQAQESSSGTNVNKDDEDSKGESV